MKSLIRSAVVALLGGLALSMPALAEDFRIGFVNTDRVFTKDNAAAYMPEAY